MGRGALEVLYLIKATGIAGAENHLLQLLPEIDRRRFRVRIVLLTDPKKPAEDFAEALHSAGIPVERLPLCGPADPLCLFRLDRLLRRTSPALVHTHLVHADLYGGLLGVLHPRLRLISTRHGDDPFRRRWLFRRMNRFLHRRSDAVIAISEWLRDFVVTVEGAPPNRVVTIPYGLRPMAGPGLPREEARRLLSAGTEDLLVGAVGRLIAQKRYEILIRSLASLQSGFPKLRLVVVGGGPMRPFLEEEARRLGVASRVVFTGFRRDARDLMVGFDVLGHPSWGEGFGMTLLEAMERGVPIVACRVSAVPEVVLEGETGLLVPPDDPQAFAEALERLLRDPGLRSEMGRRGAERALREFSVERMARHTEALYERALAGMEGRSDV